MDTKNETGGGQLPEELKRKVVGSSGGFGISRKERAWQEYRTWECFESDGRANGFSKGYDAASADAAVEIARLRGFIEKISREKGEYGRYGYNQPTQLALDAQAILSLPNK